MLSPCLVTSDVGLDLLIKRTSTVFLHCKVIIFLSDTSKWLVGSVFKGNIIFHLTPSLFLFPACALTLAFMFSFGRAWLPRENLFTKGTQWGWASSRALFPLHACPLDTKTPELCLLLGHAVHAAIPRGPPRASFLLTTCVPSPWCPRISHSFPVPGFLKVHAPPTSFLNFPRSGGLLLSREWSPLLFPFYLFLSYFSVADGCPVHGPLSTCPICGSCNFPC